MTIPINVFLHTVIGETKQAIAADNQTWFKRMSSTDFSATTVSMNVTNNTTLNSTAMDTDSKSKGYVGMIIAMFLLALVFNISALIMIVRSSKSHKWSAFYRLMVSLNITDLVGSVTCFPVLLATYANNVEWQGGQPVCDYTGYMISFVFLSSASIIGAMSTERFVGVWFPFFYNKSGAKERRTNIILGGIWTTTACIALLPIIGFGEYVLQYPGTWCFYNFRAKNLADKVYAYLYSVIWILIIFCTVLFNLLVIVKLVMRRVSASDKKKQNSKAKRNEIYSIVLLVVIVIVTATCGVPLAVSYFYMYTPFLEINYADFFGLVAIEIHVICKSDPYEKIRYVHSFTLRLLFSSHRTSIIVKFISLTTTLNCFFFSIGKVVLCQR